MEKSIFQGVTPILVDTLPIQKIFQMWLENLKKEILILFAVGINTNNENK